MIYCANLWITLVGSRAAVYLDTADKQAISRDKCVAVLMSSMAKLSGMPWMISGEISWDAVCNGCQSVKAMSKSIVNRNA